MTSSSNHDSEQEVRAQQQETRRNDGAKTENDTPLFCIWNNDPPQNIQQGLAKGLYTIFEETLGGASASVIIVMYGLVNGHKAHGILGGIVGGTGGLLFGFLGAVFIALYGVMKGMTKIYQGVIAVTPFSRPDTLPPDDDNDDDDDDNINAHSFGSDSDTEPMSPDEWGDYDDDDDL
mmetsp:Transcript_16829/g.38790  ORF Transcript_16829/g.38790 Transcript_16829/m.38790 type:complete len:177 (-) Transcript_16829:858-1388(-)